jgi:hypothetical protein
MSTREIVRAGAVVTAVALCLGFAPSSGSSAIIRVPDEQPTIQEAVNAAGVGGCRADHHGLLECREGSSLRER